MSEKPATKLRWGNIYVIWTALYILILARYIYFAQVLNKMRKYSELVISQEFNSHRSF